MPIAWDLLQAVVLVVMCLFMATTWYQIAELFRRIESLTQRHEHLVESLDVQHQINREQLRLINELAYDAARKGGG